MLSRGVKIVKFYNECTCPQKILLVQKSIFAETMCKLFLKQYKTDINSTVNSEEPNQLASSETT